MAHTNEAKWRRATLTVALILVTLAVPPFSTYRTYSAFRIVTQ